MIQVNFEEVPGPSYLGNRTEISWVSKCADTMPKSLGSELSWVRSVRKSAVLHNRIFSCLDYGSTQTRWTFKIFKIKQSGQRIIDITPAANFTISVTHNAVITKRYYTC